MSTLSSELEAATIVVAAALPFERAALVRGVPGARRLAQTRFPVWFRDDDGTAIVQMGIGPERAAACAAWLVHAAPRATLVNLGCAGGLAPQLTAGAAVVADAVWFESVRYAINSDEAERLRRAACRAGLLVEVAPHSCVAEPILTAGAKRAAHAESGAIAVDMESGALARVAAAERRAFSVGRVILDDALTTLGLDTAGALESLPVDRVATALAHWMKALLEPA